MIILRVSWQDMCDRKIRANDHIYESILTLYPNGRMATNSDDWPDMFGYRLLFAEILNPLGGPWP